MLAARLNVLSSAFSHIFARHQMILRLNFQLTQTWWKQPVFGLVPPESPLAQVSLGALANLQEASVKTIPPKSVEYLSMGVSRRASVILKSMRVIQGTVYDLFMHLLWSIWLLCVSAS